MQKKISTKVDLLNNDGQIITAGYSNHMLLNYNRNTIKKKLKIKEWDFYQIINDEYCLQLTIGHISYISSISVNLFSIKGDKKYSLGVMKLFPMDSLNMEINPEEDHTLQYENNNFKICFTKNKNKRYLIVEAKNKKYQTFKVDLELTEQESNDAMVIATSFLNKPNKFYLNYKQNCLLAKGIVIINEEKFLFNEENSFGLLDWGRGVWPYKTEWYWGNASYKLKDGRMLGLNIGDGFGDLTIATEDMLFINGSYQKLEKVYHRQNSDKTITFSTSDNRLNLTMKPIYDNYTKTSLGLVSMKCHQVFGLFNGFIITEDRKTIEIKDMLAFFEHAKNRW